jgi:hypothetical protein
VPERLEAEVALESGAKGSKTMDPANAVRFTFALVFRVAALDEALFAPGDRTSRALIAEEMSGYVVRGASIP